jgi:hypothetical protein
VRIHRHPGIIQLCVIFIYFYLSTFIAHYLCVSSSHSHYWLCYLGNARVTATQCWCWSVMSSFIQLGFILQSFILHSYFTFCSPLSFILQSKSSFWTPNYQAYQDFFIL